MTYILQEFWPLLTAAITFFLAISASGHALIYKRDSRSAVGWVGLIWLAPIVGALLYLLLGINRVRRKASDLRAIEPVTLTPQSEFVCEPATLRDTLDADNLHLLEMARLGACLTNLDLLAGNAIEPLQNGDAAYPAMLDAIANARRSITLTTYIFDNDPVGREFVEALAAAVARGVAVRVLIDAVGARYSLPPITQRLRSRGVRVARFMPHFLPWTTPYLNLRSHRKIMVVDGHTGFTGGMNIRVGNCLDRPTPHPVRDLHFRVTGPVVHELQAIFMEDWQFTTGEKLDDAEWWAPPTRAGSVMARAIPDGPDKRLDNMRMAFLGALAVAKRQVKVVTPYFLPDAALISALNTCAMRGVEVDIVLPAQNNLKWVAWASMAQMWQVLEWGCRVWLTPPPFDHAKLLVIDSGWSLIGSSNWDPRSLRLNFEFGLECYDATLARQLESATDERIAAAQPLTLEQANSRPLPVQLRDGLARLFSPYL